MITFSNNNTVLSFITKHYYRNKLLSRFQIPLSSRFWNRDNKAGTKGTDPLVPGEITGTKGQCNVKKYSVQPRTRTRDLKYVNFLNRYWATSSSNGIHRISNNINPGHPAQASIASFLDLSRLLG